MKDGSKHQFHGLIVTWIFGSTLLLIHPYVDDEATLQNLLAQRQEELDMTDLDIVRLKDALPDADDSEKERWFSTKIHSEYPNDDQLLLWSLAEGVPFVAAGFGELAEFEREEYLSRYFLQLGRMARPAADLLRAIAVDAENPHRQIAFDALVVSGGHPDYVEECLRETLSRSWTPEDTATEHAALHALELLETRPVKGLNSELSRMAAFHPSIAVQYSAIKALLKSEESLRQKHTSLLVGKLHEKLAFFDSYGNTLSCQELARDSLRDCQSVSNYDARNFIKLLYRSTYDPIGDVDLLAKLSCRSDSVDPEMLQFVQHRFPILLDEGTWLPGTEFDALGIRLAIARVLLKYSSDDITAPRFLKRVISGELTAQVPPKQYVDFRELAVSAFQELGDQGSMHLQYLREVLHSAVAERPDSGLAIASALAVASIDPQDAAAMSVLRLNCRVVGENLHLSEDLWAVYCLTLGPRIDQLILPDQVVDEVRTPEQLINLTANSVFWKLRDPHFDALLPQLKHHFQSEYPTERKCVMRVLGNFPSHLQDVQDLLLKGTADACTVVRAEAADTLGKLPTRDPKVIQRLQEMVHDPRLTVQIAAQDALKRLGPEETTEATPR